MDLSVLHSPQPAKTGSIFRNYAVMDTQSAGNAVIRSGRIFREVVSPAAVPVNLFNLRPDTIKMRSDTIGTKTNGV
jgi:phage portal protein BeeE